MISISLVVGMRAKRQLQSVMIKLREDLLASLSNFNNLIVQYHRQFIFL